MPRAVLKPLRFQHTAARRRLGTLRYIALAADTVSTHSRPKAAGLGIGVCLNWIFGFNTQPPEGGWTSDQFLITS